VRSGRHASSCSGHAIRTRAGTLGADARHGGVEVRAELRDEGGGIRNLDHQSLVSFV